MVENSTMKNNKILTETDIKNLLAIISQVSVKGSEVPTVNELIEKLKSMAFDLNASTEKDAKASK